MKTFGPKTGEQIMNLLWEAKLQAQEYNDSGARVTRAYLSGEHAAKELPMSRECTSRPNHRCRGQASLPQELHAIVCCIEAIRRAALDCRSQHKTCAVMAMFDAPAGAGAGAGVDV